MSFVGAEGTQWSRGKECHRCGVCSHQGCNRVWVLCLSVGNGSRDVTASTYWSMPCHVDLARV
ncbi:hypothetical protein HaLaN_18065 [Haematococcus lacustris]|uniref:Uncharacterized protein n=1 Tax=Haematococcus lacustris TaxID=44745 RepID=A0A699ZR37_HAELA|nr:hypothetical protein HaLaN_18065 [Haematococcus lacustris]